MDQLFRTTRHLVALELAVRGGNSHETAFPGTRHHQPPLRDDQGSPLSGEDGHHQRDVRPETVSRPRASVGAAVAPTNRFR